MYILKILRVVGVVSQWADEALADGKVEGKEILNLVYGICDVFGVEAEIKFNKEVE